MLSRHDKTNIIMNIEKALRNGQTNVTREHPSPCTDSSAKWERGAAGIFRTLRPAAGLKMFH